MVSQFTPTARLLLDAFRAFENQLADILGAQGFADVTPGNFNILRHLNPEGMRLSELARDAQISKQAIGKMISELENKGYVSISPDKTDGRAKHVRYTTKGHKLIELSISIVKDMESNYQSILGKKEYADLRHSINRIFEWHLSRKDPKHAKENR